MSIFILNVYCKLHNYKNLTDKTIKIVVGTILLFINILIINF